jgi:hypothetical protein
LSTAGKIAAILNPGRMLSDGIPYPDYAGADAIRPARVTATPLFPARVHEAIVAAGLSDAMVEGPAP